MGAAPAEVVWTDGGGALVGTPLAVASWAVFFGPGDPRNGCGRVGGPQTAQRGELEAACRAAALRRGPLLIVTDSRYVADGVARLSTGPVPPEVLHADLWSALASAGGGEVRARWVPAHRPAPLPPLLSDADWQGNAAADRLASAAVAAHAPAPGLALRIEPTKNF